MKRLLSVTAAAALAISTLAVAPQTASADIRCTGTLSGRQADDVHVPAGASCILDNAYINGDVEVDSKASLTVRSNSTITGNLQADDASPNSIIVNGGSVDGDIQVKYATGAVRITADTHVGGNIQIEEGKSPIEITRTVVAGDIQIFKNTVGPITINSNMVSGNLQCKGNSPAPTGSKNEVRGNIEDQCRDMGRGGGGSTPNVDVYITPGVHTVSGRKWRTTCEPYSTTERCRTEIEATTVTQQQGRFVQRTGWMFNNLTYKASPRSTWKNNPLAANGVTGGKLTWTDGGRTWRTECDSALTGRNGCRTWATADVVENRNGRYVWVNKEILNNMVRFS